MTKSELTEMLRPLIKKCIQEELTSPNGTLKKLVTEVAEGLANKQLKLITETIKAVGGTQTVIRESYEPTGVEPGKTPSMHSMINNARRLVGADEVKEDAYVDVDQKFKGMDPAMREMLKESQQRITPEEGNWEPPPPIESLRGPDGKIDPSHAGSLGPLRDVNPNDPGIDLDSLIPTLKKLAKK